MNCPKCYKEMPDRKWVRIDWNDEEKKMVHMGQKVCLECAINDLEEMRDARSVP